MNLSTNEFIDKLGIALKDNLIDENQYDNYMYECAVAQAYDPEQLDNLMGYILDSIYKPKELEEPKE